MEIFSFAVVGGLLALSACANVFLLRKLLESLENFRDGQESLVGKVNDVHRSLLDLREAQESTKPNKSNNWVSVRKAFSGPARVDVDE